MRKSKLQLTALTIVMLLSVLLCASPSFASGTSSMNQQEATITIPLTQWNELKSNNEKALNLTEASSVPLTEAQNLVMKQKNELTEAHNTINEIGERIDASQASINEARGYLKRNAELFDRIERANRERQENH